jgi:hypothetical protein
MLREFFVSLALLSFSSGWATLVGNPAQPALLEKSIIRSTPSWWSFRVGYFDDWIYREHFHDEFKPKVGKRSQTFVQLSTYSALLTLNFIDRVDLYGLVGSARMQIDDDVFTKRALSWGIGIKCVLYKLGNFFLGADGKYFVTHQKPQYLVFEDLPYNIYRNFELTYQEIEGAVGLSYLAWIFAPYINATYILTKILPHPEKFLVYIPDTGDLTDMDASPSESRKKWGMALGLTLTDSQKASLSLEWRTFNQDAINVNAEIRF